MSGSGDLSRPTGRDRDAIASLRHAVAATGRRLAAAGLVPGTSGNVSARAGDAVAVTATGLNLADASADAVSVVSRDGTPLSGRLEPTSELPLHLAVYARFPPAAAVVHTHAVGSTAVSCLVDELPPIHYATLQLGGAVRVAPFMTFGTPELADAVVLALDGRRGALMANHGAITWGESLAEAVGLTVVLEWLCEVYLRASAAGAPRTLSAAQLDGVAEAIRVRGYGQPTPRA